MTLFRKKETKVLLYVLLYDGSTLWTVFSYIAFCSGPLAESYFAPKFWYYSLGYFSHGQEVSFFLVAFWESQTRARQ